MFEMIIIKKNYLHIEGISKFKKQKNHPYNSSLYKHVFNLFSPTSANEMSNMVRATLPNIKVTRFKGKRAYPSLPNQPSEASAHFMFELAKQVLTKAEATVPLLFSPNRLQINILADLIEPCTCAPFKSASTAWAYTTGSVQTG